MSILFDKELLTVVSTVAITVAYATALQWMFKRTRERRKSEKNNFFSVLRNGLKSGDIETLADVYNLYNGVCRITDDSTAPSKLSGWLREFLVTLFEEEEMEDRKSWKEKITKYMEDHETQSPYADLPELERNLFADVERYIASDDKESTKRKIGELVTSVQAREESIQRIRSMNRWSVPLAVIGLILTITFGIISIVKNGEPGGGDNSVTAPPSLHVTP